MTLEQWLDLRNQSQACMTVPETCGTQGGTLSLWFKVLDYQPHGAIIGNNFSEPKTSVSITCWQPTLRYVMQI